MQEPTLLRLAVNFVGGDSSFKGQARVLQCVKAALKTEGTDVIDLPGPVGETALIAACRCGQLLAVKYLLSCGADARLADDDGITALHWLSFFDDEDMAMLAERLVSNGANIDARTTGFLDLPEHAINLQAGCTPLHYAVAMRSSQAVKTLLQLSADPFQEATLAFAYQTYSLTPLHFATSLYFHEIVNVLLKVPGTSDRVRFTCRQIPAPMNVSIINLANVCLVMPSDMAPFSRILTHGVSYEEALDKTLSEILEVFPDKDVLELAHMKLNHVCIPAEDPYVWRAWKRHGLGPRKLSIQELCQIGLPSHETTLHQGPNWEVELWLRATLGSCKIQKCSTATSHAALAGFADRDQEIDLGYVIQILETCVSSDFDGLLSVVLPRLNSSSMSPVLEFLAPFLFFIAAEQDAVDCLEVLWKVLIEDAGNDDLKNMCIEFQKDSMSALHSAAQENATRAIKFLLEHGWDIDRDLGKTGTALNVAASSFAMRDAAILLLERGASLFCCREQGEGFSVMHRAVQCPDVHLKGDQQFSLIRILVESCPDIFLPVMDKLVRARDEKLKQTALHLAIFHSDMPSFLTLLEFGQCDLAVQNAMGFTPLMMAEYKIHFREGQSDGLEAGLLRRGWDRSEVEKQNLRDQAWMVERWRQMVELLVEASSPTPEKLAIANEYEFLIKHAVLQFVMATRKPGCDEHDELGKAFKHFAFMQGPSAKTGLDPAVGLNKEDKTIVLFPDGYAVGRSVPSVAIQYGSRR
ncbi:ankyrin repeat-containing domain protein [Lasiosphaeria miniovina]|uniref:Ankyrin repeat-containing domain protein n=1 Tax=Lasiosphaeria miniovina TaxID=1954250 RepID=A0AA40A4X8_9PEZI|nr:ankyrin repeat-containing domain protein [Lasiosphaeria miniovina]KAK0709245.1 ankyrin repeat-containing domain protein [Lasiosphaeria miniovina]